MDDAIKDIYQSQYVQGWIDSRENMVKELEKWDVYDGHFGAGWKAATERIKHGIPRMDRPSSM